MGKRKTQEEFVAELKKKNPSVTVKGNYIGNHILILCTCNECKSDFEMRPADLLRGHRCKMCALKESANKRKMTHDEFITKLHKIYPDVEVLTEYKRSSEYIQCRCTKCNNVWNTKPNYLMSGNKCPICSNKAAWEKSKWSQKYFEEKLNSINSDIEILGKYNGYNNKILVRCKNCKYVYETTPHILLSGHKCKKCAMKQVGESKLKDNNDFINQLKEISPNIQLITEYINSKEQVKCMCLDCGNVWYATPNNLLRGTNCPVCCIKSSKIEKRIKECLDLFNIEYTAQKKYRGLIGVGNKLLSYDFYIPKYNILVEAQGQQHEHAVGIFGGEEQFKIQQEHDRRKKRVCKGKWTEIIRNLVL